MIRKTKDTNMTEGPILWKLFRFALPIMMTGVLQLLFSATDMAVVGRFSENGVVAVGAIGACSALINLIISSSMGLSLGVSVAISHDMGSGARENVRRIVNTALVTGACMGVVVCLGGVLLAKPLLALTETPDSVFAEAVPYMRAYFLGVPASMTYNYLASALRASGDTKRPLFFLMVAGTSNVLFNLVAVLGFGMGAVGVGLATAISHYVSLTLILIYMTRSQSAVHIDWRKLEPDRRSLIRILRLGIPACLQAMLFAFSNVLIQSTVNSYGDIMVSGNAAAANISGFVYTAMNSAAQGVIVFAGQNMGAKKYRRLDRVLLCGVGLVSCIGLLTGISSAVFGRSLLNFYVPGEVEVIEAGMYRLIYMSAPYFLCGVMDSTSYLLKGMGKQVIPTLIVLIGTVLFRVVWIFTVCRIFPGSPETLGNISYLYISYPVTWIIAISANLIYYTYLKKRLLAGTLDVHV